MNFFRFLLIGSLVMLPASVLAADTLSSSEAEPSSQASEPTPSPNMASELMMYALSLIGVDYKYGGKSPDSGLDCSGFVSHVFSHVAGMALPHSTYAMRFTGQSIPVAELKPGDLVFFNTLRNAFSHVGIYLGDNRFIHATSNMTGNIMISNMNDQYWNKRFNGARRILTSSSASK